MTTLQTGAKVLIEATVENTDHDYAIRLKTKSGDTLWIKPSDLTVCETAEPISTPSFKAGQDVEWISVADDMPEDGAKVLCYSEKYNDSFIAVCHNKDNDGRFEFSDKCFYWAGTEVSHWMPLPTRPIPAQPTVESDNKLKCTDCGAPMNEGERKTFTCCDECWNKTYVHSNMAETKINTEVDELKDMLTNCKFTIQDILAWHQKHTGRMEVSVPSDEEIENRYEYYIERSGFNEPDAVIKTVRHFMTRKEQRG